VPSLVKKAVLDFKDDIVDVKDVIKDLGKDLNKI
jgi:hypothetical protein